MKQIRCYWKNNRRGIAKSIFLSTTFTYSRTLAVHWSGQRIAKKAAKMLGNQVSCLMKNNTVWSQWSRRLDPKLKTTCNTSRIWSRREKSHWLCQPFQERATSPQPQIDSSNIAHNLPISHQKPKASYYNSQLDYLYTTWSTSPKDLI